MSKNLRVILLNVASPNLNINEFKAKCENIPIACGYLKSYAHARGITEEVTIDIAPQYLMDFGGDLAIISHICEGRYDIAGFSLYQWNALRSLHIMREVKKRRPEMIFVAGGPEAGVEAEYLVSEMALDYLVVGEGEEPFRMLLGSILEKGIPRDEIPGLIFRHRDEMVCNKAPEAIRDVSGIPSPYLLGFIELDNQHILHLETMRGCTFNCRYCSWKRGGRHGVSFFPLERLQQEILLAMEKGIRKIRFLDGNLNISKKWLIDLCKLITAVTRDYGMEFLAFAYPELIDEESAFWMAKANLKLFLGLQSANPEALKTIGREVNLEKYLQGTSIIKKYGVGFSTSIILGLPGDTAEGFKSTMDFLLKNEQMNTICFPLSLSPNTQLRQEASALGIQYQKMPPNLVISTPTMSFEDLRACIKLFRRDFSFRSGEGTFEKDLHYTGNRNFPIGHHYHWEAYPSLVTYVQGRYPWKNGNTRREKTLKEVLSSSRPLTRIIFSAESRPTDKRTIKKMAEMLSPRVSWNTVLWFQEFGTGSDPIFLQEFLSLLSKANPGHILHIIIEFEREVDLTFLRKVAHSMESIPNHLDYESLYEQRKPLREYAKLSPIIYAIVPYDRNRFSRKWILELNVRVPFFWSLTLPAGNRERPDVGKGFLVDFSPEYLPHQILHTLSTMKNSSVDRIPFFFRNWVLQRVWTLCCLGFASAWGVDENILELREKNRALVTHLSEDYLMRHLKDWVKGHKS